VSHVVTRSVSLGTEVSLMSASTSPSLVVDL